MDFFWPIFVIFTCRFHFLISQFKILYFKDRQIENSTFFNELWPFNVTAPERKRKYAFILEFIFSYAGLPLHKIHEMSNEKVHPALR